MQIYREKLAFRAWESDRLVSGTNIFGTRTYGSFGSSGWLELCAEWENKSDTFHLVEKSFNFLKSNPYMHEICHDPLLASKGYRKAMIHNHVMIYAINILKGEVMILRIFYESRNNIPLL
jgi:hypothetical protein